jgi:hypothetical protein
MSHNRSKFLYGRHTSRASANDSNSLAFDVETLRPGCGMETAAFESSRSQTRDIWNIWSGSVADAGEEELCPTYEPSRCAHDPFVGLTIVFCCFHSCPEVGVSADFELLLVDMSGVAL